MGLSRIVYEIDGNFSRRTQNFPIPLYFAPPLKGVPLEIGYRVSAPGSQNYGATGPTKKFNDIFSRLDTVHERDRRTDGQTDRQTDTGRQQRPRLSIASRGKKKSRNFHDFNEITSLTDHLEIDLGLKIRKHIFSPRIDRRNGVWTVVSVRLRREQWAMLSVRCRTPSTRGKTKHPTSFTRTCSISARTKTAQTTCRYQDRASRRIAYDFYQPDAE